MKLAHIVAEYMIHTIDDIATMVGSVSFAKSTRNALVTASIHAASWLFVAMFYALSSSLSKVQAPFELTQWVHPLYWHHPGNNNRSMMYYWYTNTIELPRLTGKVGTHQCRGVVGLPMMVLTLVIGSGSGNNNEGCSNNINNNNDGRFDGSLVRWERTSVYFFPST
jgi:hypothetical protein